MEFRTAHRDGVLPHILIAELDTGTWENNQCEVVISEHKTFKSSGVADVVFPADVYDLVCRFKEIRSRVPFKTDPYLFAKWSPSDDEGKALQSGQTSRVITSGLRKAGVIPKEVTIKSTDI